MIKRSHVKSFYNGLLVTCYECGVKKYVSNQHGDWDVYEGEYVKGEKRYTVPKDADEIKKIINECVKQEREGR